MNTLVANGQVDGATRQPVFSNRGNVILIRRDKASSITSICDPGGATRVVTPNPITEPGSFGNFSGAIFNVADQNVFGCDASVLFNSIFSQDLSTIDMTGFANPCKS